MNTIIVKRINKKKKTGQQYFGCPDESKIKQEPLVRDKL